jgi:tripartite-type tricarboxylate transporter receptor subunit TctC
MTDFARRLRVAGLMLCLFAAIPFAATPSPAKAQSVEEFYKGKQLRIIIGQPPGNRGDLVARMVSKYMTKYLPGNPQIVPQNMPAAGTLAAANHIYNVAPRDGTVWGVFSRSIPVQAVMGQEGVHADPRKYGWIGSPEGVEQMCLSYKTSPIQKAEDLFEKEMIVGGSGPATVTNYVPVVAQSTLGMKFKVITGYGGAAEVFLAMERGEVQGICTVYDQITGFRPNWLKDGTIKLLFHTSTTPSPSTPGLRSIYDFVKTDEQRKVIFFVNSGVEFGRPFATPPEVPPERLKALREAFAKAIQDPEFLEEGKKIDFDPVYTSGEKMDDLVKELYATPKELIDRSAKLMGM